MANGAGEGSGDGVGIGNISHEHANAHHVARMAAKLADVIQDLLETAIRLPPGIRTDAAILLYADIAGNDDPVPHANGAGKSGGFLERSKRRYALAAIVGISHR